MRYKIYNTNVSDVHFISLGNYTIKLEFYPVDYWILRAKYYKHEYCSSLYLPTLTIDIYNNKKIVLY